MRRATAVGVIVATAGGALVGATLARLAAPTVASPPDPPAAATPPDVPALAAIYQADRAENASTLGVVLAMLGAGIGYLTATLAFSAEIFAGIGWVAVFIPVPLWVIAAYHSLLAVTAMVRSLSVRRLEAELVRATAVAPAERVAIGMTAAERILNVTDAAVPHRVATGIAYGGIGLLVVGYTAYMVAQDDFLDGLAKGIAYGGYTVVALLVAWSWTAGFALYDRNAATLR